MIHVPVLDSSTRSALSSPPPPEERLAFTYQIIAQSALFVEDRLVNSRSRAACANRLLGLASSHDSVWAEQ